jgi:stage II sporulation protein B
MDKARITYRFEKGSGGSNKMQRAHGNESENRENRDKRKVVPLYQDEFRVVGDDRTPQGPESPIFDTQSLNQFTTDFGAWSSPFDEETERLEKLIRASDRPAEQEPNEELEEDRSFGDGHDAETGFYSHNTQDKASYYRGPWVDEGVTRSRYSRKTTTPWLKIISSVTGAVMTGLLFGFFVLSMFTGEEQGVMDSDSLDVLNSSSAPSQQEAKQPSAAENSASSLDATAATAAAGTAVVQLPAKTYFMLQNGVFSSLEGAEEAQNTLRQRGLAAAAGDFADNYYIYAGMTTDRNDAYVLSHHLKEQELEVYIKPYDIPAVNRIAWNGGNAPSAQAQTYFARGSLLIKMIGDLSIMHLKEKQPASFDPTTMQSLRKEHQAWVGLLPVMQQGMPEQAQAALQKMTNAVHTAVISMEEYNKNPSFAHLWQAQSAIMEYILTEKQLLTVIAAE